MDSAILAAFFDELEKVASSHGRMRIPKARSGRRPISVDKLLQKEKDGTLYKESDGDLPLPKKRALPGKIPGIANDEENRMDGRSEVPTFESPRAALSQIFNGT